MTIILLPDPSALIKLYSDYSSGGSHRLSLVVGEFRRFSFFLRPYPLLPIVLFFGMVGLIALFRNCSRITNVLAFARQYTGILIYGLSVLMGLALLPTAEWPHYLVFYIPILAILAALAYSQKPPGTASGLMSVSLVIIAIVAELAILAILRDNLEAWVIVSLLLAIPIAILLWLSWILGRREWLIAALMLGAVVRLGLMAADYHAYNHIADTVRARAVEIEADTILGPPQLNWAFAQDDFTAITYLTRDAPGTEFGLVALPQIWYRDRWIETASESCEFGEASPIHLSTFVSNKLRETQWETMTIECTQPPHHP